MQTVYRYWGREGEGGDTNSLWILRFKRTRRGMNYRDGGVEGKKVKRGRRNNRNRGVEDKKDRRGRMNHRERGIESEKNERGRE